MKNLKVMKKYSLKIKNFNFLHGETVYIILFILYIPVKIQIPVRLNYNIK